MEHSTIQLQSVEPKQVMHHLPCNINFNGKANVKKYFLDAIQTDSKDATLYSASIRGRPMQGRKIDLTQQKLKGFILVDKNAKNQDQEEEEEMQDEQSTETKEYVTKETFSTVMNWSLDRDPKVYEKQINGTIELHKLMNAFHEPLPL